MPPRDAGRDPSQWPLRVFRLGHEPRDDLLASTTAEERLDMVATLSRRAWELTGRPPATLPRSEWPIRVIRRA